MYRILKKLPTINEVIEKCPVSQDILHSIKIHRDEISDILSGRDDRLLIVLGPCSAWPYDAVLEYADALCEINQQVKHRLKLVLRTYVQKPRTITGWAGPLNQPNPLLKPDIEAGIYYSRKLMLEIAKKNLPIADEALFVDNTRFFEDLLSWMAIGARSSENQEHRIFASSIDYPVGIKNPTNGSVQIGVNGVIAVNHSHVASLNGYEIETFGNKYAHLVLRGGNGVPNYDIASLKYATSLLCTSNILNPAMIIDVSHDNCLHNGVKNHLQQGDIIFKILQSLDENKATDVKKILKGFMIESFIQSGNQSITSNHAHNSIDMNGLSITDPCLGLIDTRELLLQLTKYTHRF